MYVKYNNLQQGTNDLITTLRDLLIDSVNQINDLTQALDLLRQGYSVLQVDLAQTDELVVAQEDAIEPKEQELIGAQERFAELEAVCQALEESHKNCDSEIETLQNLNITLEAEVHNIEALHEKLLADYNASQEPVAVLTGDVTTVQVARATLLQEVGLLQHELSALRTAYEVLLHEQFSDQANKE